MHVLNSAWVTDVPPVRALRQLVPQVRHSDVRAVLFEQLVDVILPGSVTFRAGQQDHVEFGCGLAERVGTVGHHSDPSRRKARSICAVAASTSFRRPVVAAFETNSAA
jgi:hypothetical protein